MGESQRGVAGYEVRVKPEGGEWSPAYTHDSTQELLPVALDVCSDPDAPSVNRCLAMQVGTQVAVDLAGLRADTRYTISVAARDAMCGELGEMALARYRRPSGLHHRVAMLHCQRGLWLAARAGGLVATRCARPLPREPRTRSLLDSRVLRGRAVLCRARARARMAARRRAVAHLARDLAVGVVARVIGRALLIATLALPGCVHVKPHEREARRGREAYGERVGETVSGEVRESREGATASAVARRWMRLQ